MKHKNLRDNMSADLESVTARLEKARAKAEAANSKVTELERQQYALQSAIDIMDVTGPVIPKYKPSFEPKKTIDLVREMIAEAPATTEVEPGFRLGQDAEGNPILVPDSLEVHPVEPLPSYTLGPAGAGFILDGPRP